MKLHGHSSHIQCVGCAHMISRLNVNTHIYITILYIYYHIYDMQVLCVFDHLRGRILML